ncbi:hypothetical protein K8Z49_16040 [Actinomadura madurae]|uniref:hypothetical protein n=1 Tax=Actinomadura madurae TaxID=1993 RepID=UPI00399B993D
MQIEALLPAQVPQHDNPSGGTHDEARLSAAAATHVLESLVPCAAYALAAWDAMSGTHQHVTLVNRGYDDRTMSHLNDAYVDSNPAFPIFHTKTSGPLRWIDLERDWNVRFDTTYSAEELLIPAGFHEGTTMCLRLPDGRYTGALHVSWSSAREATDENIELIYRFRPLLALVCDMLRSAEAGIAQLPPDAHALVISGKGKAAELPGRSLGTFLCDGGALRKILSGHTLPRVPRRYLWADATGRCHRIEIIPCRGGAALVTEQIVPWPHCLTFREAQILHLIARGLSNLR